jgi:hypothetical protein
MSVIQYVLFLVLVGLATFCQNLTGFAFGLIFVGVAGATHLMSIADAANVACLLSVVNGVTYLRAHRQVPQWTLLKPMLVSSVIGVIAGVLPLAAGPGHRGLRPVAAAAKAGQRADVGAGVAVGGRCGLGTAGRPVRHAGAAHGLPPVPPAAGPPGGAPVPVLHVPHLRPAAPGDGGLGGWDHGQLVLSGASLLVSGWNASHPQPVVPDDEMAMAAPQRSPAAAPAPR